MMQKPTQMRQALLSRHRVDITPSELVRWIKEERADHHGQLGFFERAWKHYTFEEDFDRGEFGLDDNEVVDHVSVEAVLDVEPFMEHNYWILRVKVKDDLGIMHADDEQALLSGELSLEDFEEEFLEGEHQQQEVILLTETDFSKRHFDRWFFHMKKLHGLNKTIKDKSH